MFPAVGQWAGQKAGRPCPAASSGWSSFARCLMLDPQLVIRLGRAVGRAWRRRFWETVFDAIKLMNSSGKTILLVEQNARAGLRLASHAVVLENGRVRLAGTGQQVLDNPEIGALYLGGPPHTRTTHPD